MKKLAESFRQKIDTVFDRHIPNSLRKLASIKKPKALRKITPAKSVDRKAEYSTFLTKLKAEMQKQHEILQLRQEASIAKMQRDHLVQLKSLTLQFQAQSQVQSQVPPEELQKVMEQQKFFLIYSYNQQLLKTQTQQQLEKKALEDAQRQLYCDRYAKFTARLDEEDSKAKAKQQQLDEDAKLTNSIVSMGLPEGAKQQLEKALAMAKEESKPLTFDELFQQAVAKEERIFAIELEKAGFTKDGKLIADVETKEEDKFKREEEDIRAKEESVEGVEMPVLDDGPRKTIEQFAPEREDTKVEGGVKDEDHFLGVPSTLSTPFASPASLSIPTIATDAPYLISPSSTPKNKREPDQHFLSQMAQQIKTLRRNQYVKELTRLTKMRETVAKPLPEVLLFVVLANSAWMPVVFVFSVGLRLWARFVVV